MLPKVSVHLPSYQQREFLRAAIESVLAQEYDNLEIVVGDDGSTDGTHDMVRDYARRFPGTFVPVLSTENRGTTANWNQILPRCTGDYVAWLDGDDLWLPGKLHRQIAFMEAHPDVVLTYTNAEHFESDGGRVTRLQHEARRNPFRGGEGEQMFRSASFFITSTVVARRSAIPPWGADPRLPMTSDWLLWVDITRHGRIGFLRETYTRYRRHANNITNRGAKALSDQLAMIAFAEGRYVDTLPLTPSIRAETLWYNGLGFLTRGEHRQAALCFQASFRSRLVTLNVPTLHKLAIWLLLATGQLGLVLPMVARVGRALHRLRSRRVALDRVV